MNIEKSKNIIYSLLFLFVVTIALSVFADVAYIYTLCGLSIWMAFGHLVTLDDDMPGEWSNPENSPKIWKSSLFELAVKFGILIVLVTLIFTFPALTQYGV